jgi:hypothetical protein
MIEKSIILIPAESQTIGFYMGSFTNHPILPQWHATWQV